MKWWMYVIGVGIACVLLLWLSGCSHKVNPNSAAALRARQQAIQNCIVTGGHPRLGPDNSILCVQE